MLDLGETVHVVIQCSNGASSTAEKVERRYCPRRLHSMAHHTNDSTARLREPLQWLHPLSICIGKHRQTMRCNEGTADHESICSTLQKSATHYYIGSQCSTSRAIMNLHVLFTIMSLIIWTIQVFEHPKGGCCLYYYSNIWIPTPCWARLGGAECLQDLESHCGARMGVAKHVLPFHSLCGAYTGYVTGTFTCGW